MAPAPWPVTQDHKPVQLKPPRKGRFVPAALDTRPPGNQLPTFPQCAQDGLAAQPYRGHRGLPPGLAVHRSGPLPSRPSPAGPLLRAGLPGPLGRPRQTHVTCSHEGCRIIVIPRCDVGTQLLEPLDLGVTGARSVG